MLCDGLWMQRRNSRCLFSGSLDPNSGDRCSSLQSRKGEGTEDCTRQGGDTAQKWLNLSDREEEDACVVPYRVRRNYAAEKSERTSQRELHGVVFLSLNFSIAHMHQLAPCHSALVCTFTWKWISCLTNILKTLLFSFKEKGPCFLLLSYPFFILSGTK